MIVGDCICLFYVATPDRPGISAACATGLLIIRNLNRGASPTSCPASPIWDHGQSRCASGPNLTVLRMEVWTSTLSPDPDDRKDCSVKPTSTPPGKCECEYGMTEPNKSWLTSDLVTSNLIACSHAFGEFQHVFPPDLSDKARASFRGDAMFDPLEHWNHWRRC